MKDPTGRIIPVVIWAGAALVGAAGGAHDYIVAKEGDSTLGGAYIICLH